MAETVHSSQWRSKISIYGVILSFVLLASILLRLLSASSQGYQVHTDWALEYLVAHHIVEYRELPLFSTSSAQILTTPLFFYFTAAFLLLNDSIAFLGIVNLVLQAAGLVLVYAIARRLFGRGSAFIALIFFGFSELMVGQAHTFWPPWVMQPFLLLSYFLLVVSLQRKSYAFLTAGIAVFVFAAALHNAAFAVFPALLLYGILLCRLWRKSAFHYLGLAATFLVSLLVFFFPLFLYSVQQESSFRDSGIGAKFATALAQPVPVIIHQLVSRFFLFWDYLSFAEVPKIIILVFLGGLFGTYFFFGEKGGQPAQRRVGLLIVLGICMGYFGTVALLPVPDQGPWPAFPLHYFAPIFAPFLILLGELIGRIPLKGIGGIGFRFALVIMVLSALSPNLVSLARQLVAERGRLFDFGYRTHPAVRVLEQELKSIQAQEQRPQLDFFRIRTYEPGWTDNFANSLLWTPLEKDFGIKLVAVKAIHQAQELTSDEYIVLNCSSFASENNDQWCKQRFLMQHPRHKILKEVIRQKPYSLYLAQRLPPGEGRAD